MKSENLLSISLKDFNGEMITHEVGTCGGTLIKESRKDDCIIIQVFKKDIMFLELYADSQQDQNCRL